LSIAPSSKQDAPLRRRFVDVADINDVMYSDDARALR
jgi:hypothetical protein